MGDTSFVKYNHRILSINKGNSPDVLTESITVPSFRGYTAGEVIPAGTKLIDIINKEFKTTPPPTPKYTITVRVDGQGSTSPAVGSYEVEEGDSFTMTSATPASGWNLGFVTLDGANVTLPHTINNVTGAHTFEVNFAETPVVVTYNIAGTVQGGNGTISPENYGPFEEGTNVASQTFTASAASGYEVDKWYFDGAETQQGGDSYHTPAITSIDADHTVKVTFKESVVDHYKVTITDATSGLSNYGTINPAARVAPYEVIVESTYTVTATPDPGFKIKSFTVDGTAETIADPTQAHTAIIPSHAKDVTVAVVVEFEQLPSGNIYNDAYIAASGRTYKESDIVEANAVLGTPAADPAGIVAQMKGAGYAWHTHAQAKSVETFLIAKSLGRCNSFIQNGMECFNNTIYEKTFTIDGVEYWCYHNTTVGAGNTDYTIKGE